MGCFPSRGQPKQEQITSNVDVQQINSEFEKCSREFITNLDELNNLFQNFAKEFNQKQKLFEQGNDNK